MLDITAHVNALADEIHAMRADRWRLLVAIAGAPGSGKSTLSSELARRLRLQKVPCEIVSLDGFQLDPKVLAARGLATRRGAPETYDAPGFMHLVSRLAGGHEDVVAPAFDRARDIAVAGSIVVEAECPVVIIEGSYLLFDEAPWNRLPEAWDLSAWLEVPLDELRGRMIQRWLTHGLSRTAATRRAMLNDGPNARRMLDRRLPADISLGYRPAP